MRTEFFESLVSAVKNWWISAIVGVLFIAVAVLMFIYPTTGYQTLAIIFSVLMLCTGLFEILFAVTNKNILPGWGWYLAMGIIELLFGLLLILNPMMTIGILPFLMAFWLMFAGFSIIGFSIDMQQYGSRTWGWYLAMGIITLIFAIGILFFPVAGALSLVYIVSFTFLFAGIARIMLAFDLKRLHDDSKALKKRIDSHHS